MKQEGDLSVRLRLWSEGDLPLLEQLLGDPQMTEHIGGPENAEQLVQRHKRYVDLPGTGKGQMFVIVANAEPAGSIGYWEAKLKGQPIYEVGWSVLPAFQGRGIASKATRAALEIIRSDGKHRIVHAFPSIANQSSNALCRSVGFSLIEEAEFEYPKGHFMRCNDWMIDLGEGGQ